MHFSMFFIGARIILACRNVEKAEEARMEIIIETSNCNISVKPLDLASAGSIQAFAKNIIACMYGVNNNNIC